MAKLNKEASTQKIIRMTEGLQVPCTKLQMDNLIFPKWSDIGLLGIIFRQCVVTKEQPNGNIYDEAKFQTVLRIVGGKVLMSGKADTYCWGFDKVKKCANPAVVGCNSAQGILNLCKILKSIVSEEDKLMVADMFSSLNKDLLIVTSPEENRICVEVTEDLYKSGLTSCVDEWMEPDEDGLAEETKLQIGDYLIVTTDGVYRVERNVFLETYTLV